MKRRMVIQVTAPAVLIGLLLFGTSLASVWAINRLQRNMAHVLSRNVASLAAVQELEIQLRQLRFHSFVYFMDPKAERLSLIEDDQASFRKALDEVKRVSNSDKERELIQAIEDGYQRYQSELAGPPPSVAGRNIDYVHWADLHPVRHLLKPCQELVRVNKEAIEDTARESERVSDWTRVAMILLGILGPISGLISGYGIARGLSRSIARLNVRLQDVHAHLDQEVASVKLKAGGNLEDLDRQMDVVVGRVREVAEQVQRHQREILRTEQLAAVGQLAASVAHEVRNPLTAIKLLVGAALKRQNQTGLSAEDLQVIHSEIVRLEQKVQGLLDFARPPAVQRETTDLRDVIVQALNLVRSRADHQHVTILVRQLDVPVCADVDRNQLGNVLVNLLMNSLDVLPQGGRIEIELNDRYHQQVQILVRDSGPGLTETIEKKLFTPFITTKPTGTGLGLSICRRIVQDHHGTITGRNQPAGGAEFEIILPVVSKEEANHASVAGYR
jgi:signal transduction histidine kinase